MSETDKHWTEDYESIDHYVERVMSACRSRLSVEKAMLKLVHRRPDHKIGQAEAIVSPTGDAVLDLIKSKGEDLTAEIIDAASSMLVRDLQTMIEPVDAEASTRRGCKHLQTFTDAVKDANGITGLRQRFFGDGATCAAGFLHVYADPSTKEIKIGRWLPTQTFWDEEECPSGEEPLDLFYVDSVPCRRLEAEFPAQAKQIRDAGKYTRPRIPGVDPARVGVSDNRMVILAYSRKVGTAKGHYVMKVGKGGPILEKRRTTYEHHPVAHFVFGLEYTGWGGKSLARMVAREDLENQDLNASVVRTVRAMVPVIWKKVGTVWESTLTQDEYQVQEYDGAEPPKVEVPKIDISVVLERIAQNRIRAFARPGINPEMAQGRRPGPGLNSEPSIDAAVETSTIRLSDVQGRWGEGDRELTRALIMVGADTYGKPGSEEAVIKAPGTGMIQKIKWATDIGDVTEGKYNIQVKLASGLSLTFAGRLRDMENIKKVAPTTVTETMALKTLKLIDLETETSRLTAYTNEAERQIDVCLNQEGPVPTPYAYPELLREMVKIGKQELMRAKNGDTNYPEDNVEKLRKLIDKSGKMLADLEPPMPAAAPEAPAPVPGPPGAPPGQAQGPGPTGAVPGGPPAPAPVA